MSNMKGMSPTYQNALYPCGKYPPSAYVRHYALYIITSFGCVSNLLVIAVIFYTKRVRNSVSGIFLLGLTFADTFVLISEQIDNLTRSPIESEKIFLIDSTCGFVSLLKYSSRFTATVIVLSISFNRLIVILRPMKSHAFHKVKYAVIQVCVITVLSVIVSGPYAFCVGSSNQCGCKAIINEHIYNTAVTVVDVAFCDIIAGVLISECILNSHRLQIPYVWSTFDPKTRLHNQRCQKTGRETHNHFADNRGSDLCCSTPSLHNHLDSTEIHDKHHLCWVCHTRPRTHEFVE